ncbi:MAG: xanthine dehydrogenase accessory protein XdhC [Planctomycetota bacterium]|jgi:xanthine dehydrogenase accessory factor
MDNFDSHIGRYSELIGQGKPFVSVILVSAEGSTPQDAGSKMLVTAEGLHAGTVGGGRVEARAIREAQEMLARPEGPTTRFVEWNLQTDIGMTCGGNVKMFFEAVNYRVWSVVIFGAGHVTQALAPLLLDLPCHVTCVDPRREWLAKLPAAPHLRTVQADDPPTVVEQLPPDAFVICMTMGHRTDRPILESIFRAGLEFPFLGVIGSHSKAAVLRRELREAGIDEALTRRFVCPLGLDLGTNHPTEISISIAAQLLQRRDAHFGSTDADARNAVEQPSEAE